MWGARGRPPPPLWGSLDLGRGGRVAVEEAAEVEGLVAHLGELSGVLARLAFPATALAQAALVAFDGVALGVEEAADLEQRLDVLAAVEAMSGARLAGPQDAELALPVAQHVGLDADQARNLADLEV